MIITGRLTKDAVVNQLKDGRKVVAFTIAVNDYYKSKGQDKGVNVTHFFNCSYWLSEKIAEQLRKGVVAELFGRMGINAYVDMQGEAKATLTFHVNNIKIHQFSKDKSKAEKKEKVEETADDLPF